MERRADRAGGDKAPARVGEQDATTVHRGNMKKRNGWERDGERCGASTIYSANNRNRKKGPNRGRKVGGGRWCGPCGGRLGY
jgi:hypothetical protein